MNVLQRCFKAFNEISWMKTLRGMFAESWTSAKNDYYLLTGRSQDSATLSKVIDELNWKSEELRARLEELRLATPMTQRDVWLAIPTQSRIVYAHNRWLASPKILAFTPCAESIGLIFQLLHDSLRLARFLKRYEARACREEDYASEDFKTRVKLFDGLKTEPNAYGKDMPRLIEWSLRRGPVGPILLWNYARYGASIDRHYFETVEELSSRALFGDMPDDAETQRILMDATRRVVGDAVFNSAVKNCPSAIQSAREATSRYSNQPGDENDAQLPLVFQRWMKELDPQKWMLATSVEPGKPYWEDFPKPKPSRKIKSLEREIKAREEMRARLEARLIKLANGPKLGDLLLDAWLASWFGLAIALLNLALFMLICAVAFAALYLFVNRMIETGRMIKDFLKEFGECCCTCIFVIIVLFVIASMNSGGVKK